MSRSLNALNSIPESEAFMSKAEAFFGEGSYTALAIANRFKSDRTTVVSDFSAVVAATDVRRIEQTCDKYVGYLNSAKTKRFAKSEGGAYSVAAV